MWFIHTVYCIQKANNIGKIRKEKNIHTKNYITFARYTIYMCYSTGKKNNINAIGRVICTHINVIIMLFIYMFGCWTDAHSDIDISNCNQIYIHCKIQYNPTYCR